MPILISSPITVFDQERFHQVDRRVTGIAFDIHNEIGRFLDERLYQGELTRRCRAAGFAIEPELHITLCLDDFRKDYFADHLVDRGVIVETKAVASLSASHIGQALNYLFLCGLRHATLLNFRTEKVQHEFVSTSLSAVDRMAYEVVTNDWRPLTQRCELLHQLMLRLLTEWGAYLDPNLYRDAITHFLGGKSRVEREIPVQFGNTSVGTQRMRLHDDRVAFSVTASTHRPEGMLEHQQRFLRHTPLRAIQWINLNHQKIEFRTIEHK